MSFPNTPILDSGVGADQNPLAGNFTTAFWGEAAAQRLSNQFKGTSSSFNDLAWSASQFGPNAEFYLTVAAVDTTADFYMHLKSNEIGASGATLDDYFMKHDHTAGTIVLFKETNGSGPPALGTYTQVVAAGDSVGIQYNGSTLAAWYKASGGSWVQLGSVTDTTWQSQIGYCALEFGGTLYAFTNIGGGTIAAASALAPQRTLMGVGT